MNVLYVVLLIVLLVVIALIATKKINLGGGIDEEVERYKTSTDRDKIDGYFSDALKSMESAGSSFRYAILWSKDQSKISSVKDHVQDALNTLNRQMKRIQLISLMFKTNIGTVLAHYNERPRFNKWSIKDIVLNTGNFNTRERFDLLIEKFADLFVHFKYILLDVKKEVINNRITIKISQELKDNFSSIYKQFESIQRRFDIYAEF